MPASFIESPLTRNTNSPSSPPAMSGTGTYSSMFSSASTGDPAATWPTTGSPSGLIDWRALSTSTSIARGLVGSRRSSQPLEVAEVRVHGRRGREPDRLPDVTHRRRVPVLADVALDEVEDLLLALREVQLDHSDAPWGRFRCRNPNMCSQSTPGV